MQHLGLSMSSWWQWSWLFCLFLSPLLLTAMTLPAENSLTERCRWACFKRITTVPDCTCNSNRNLVDRFAALKDMDDAGEISHHQDRMSLLLDSLLRLKELSSLDQDMDKPDRENDQRRYTSPNDNEGQLVDFPLVQKRNYLAPRDADKDMEEAIKMVRSKKRWLSLHDDFDSRGKEGEKVVANLWNDDASRKAFRYG